MIHLLPFLERTSVAYFTMEIALQPQVHTYSGGLGVLAGDTARSCADLELPVVFVSLVSDEGYLRQEIDADGVQIDHPDPWTASDYASPLDAMVAVRIEGRSVWIRPWLYLVSCPLGPRIPVLLLDTNVDQNAPEDRRITSRLYGGDSVYRLKQEIVLGIGGARMLDALGFTISTFHLNEGHAALLALHLLRRHRREPSMVPGPLAYDTEEVRRGCVFTTHTPVEAGHDQFLYEDVVRVLGEDFFELDQLKILAGEERLNMTLLALNLSGFVNGVAARHADTTRRMFPGYRVKAITNGVHVPTWTHPAFAELFQKVLARWAHEPELLMRADQIDDQPIWSAHQSAKADLVALVAQQTGVRLDREIPTIGFARRMTGYKRPDLLFSDLARLSAIGKRMPLQIVMAGKAHPLDEPGKRLIRQIHEMMHSLTDVKAVFLPNYDMGLARFLVSGTDIWLNTPLPPLEASGTSGMKAALNGVLNLSVLDGWWTEAWIEGVTGWAVGDGGVDGRDSAALYDKLEKIVLPLYRDDRQRWIWMMKQSIAKIGSYFNSQRMMRRYASEAYLR